MNDQCPTPRSVIEAYMAAFATRDTTRISPFLAEDVEWIISGPVDVLPFCGAHHGKATALDLTSRRIPAVLKVFDAVREASVIDGDQAATLTRVKARRASDGRVISYRVAHFVRFQDGKVIRNLSLLDSFDAVEQVIGHSLGVRDGAPPADGDLISV